MDNEPTNRPPRTTNAARNAGTDSRVDDARETVQDGAESAGSIIGEIVEDVQNIVRGEVQLAKTELKEDASRIGKGAGMIGAGALLGLVGFIFVMLGVTYLLGQWMDMWLAAGIVGLALLIVAAVLAMSGKNQIENTSIGPEQTIESLKEDKEWANRQMKSAGR